MFTLYFDWGRFDLILDRGSVVNRRVKRISLFCNHGGL